MQGAMPAETGRPHAPAERTLFVCAAAAALGGVHFRYDWVVIGAPGLLFAAGTCSTAGGACSRQSLHPRSSSPSPPSFFRESPRWLLARQRDRQASDVLERVGGRAYAAEEVASIRRALADESTTRSS